MSECCPAQPDRQWQGSRSILLGLSVAIGPRLDRAAATFWAPPPRLGRNVKGLWKGDGLSLASPCPATGEGTPSPGTVAQTHCPEWSSYQASCPGSGEEYSGGRLAASAARQLGCQGRGVWEEVTQQCVSTPGASALSLRSDFSVMVLTVGAFN